MEGRTSTWHILAINAQIQSETSDDYKEIRDERGTKNSGIARPLILSPTWSTKCSLTHA
jgi:hypothetical protein